MCDCHRTRAHGPGARRRVPRRRTSTAVWNRTPAKADRLVAEGARLAPTVGDALRAASITIICVSDYPAVRELFDTTEVGGTTLLNLTSGDSAQAREVDHRGSRRGTVSRADRRVRQAPQRLTSSVWVYPP
ncbi:NAD(P)-binding domain-containing protein [Nocardia salmonicida]|uniref:NAD(P)-binding domain-containing protein n=1 Tax=Nocardia salmonicida TaxID=53431 RepID=UPI0020D2671E|nr:NAD(P)-binding domain-containing protein [Nocardia salmonicida]